MLETILIIAKSWILFILMLVGVIVILYLGDILNQEK